MDYRYIRIVSLINLATGILLIVASFAMLVVLEGSTKVPTVINLLLPALAFLAVANMGNLLLQAIKSQAERIEALEQLLAELSNESSVSAGVGSSEGVSRSSSV